MGRLRKDPFVNFRSTATRRRFVPLWARIFVFAVGLGVGMAEADANALFRRFHVWGHFRPGSWVVVRQQTETVDANRRVVSTSTSETRTTLAGVDDRCLTLRVQSSLEVGGKKLDGEPQELRQGHDGNGPEASAAPVQLVAHEVIEVQGRKYDCRIDQTEQTAGDKRTITKVWNSAEAAPFELRRLTSVVDAAGNVVEETLVEVVSLSLQRRILARTRPTAEVRIVYRHNRGRMQAQAVNCPEVPGGIVSQTAEEFDAAGKLLRRTKVELVDFETK